MWQKNWPVIGLAVVVLACVLLAGCSGPSGDGGEQTPPPTTASGTENAGYEVVEANNQFAFDLYEALGDESANAGKNIFFSPFSISSAFAIAYEGARGATADEIKSVLHFPENITTLREGYRSINAGPNAEDAAYELRTANALWAEQSYAFLPEYIRVARDYYGADATNMNFLNQPDPSRVMINQWVEDQTNDKIKDLLPPGSITGDTRLVITNAVYFYGTWEKQFEKDETEEADFRVSDSKTVTVEMMQRTDDEAVFGYAETDTLQALSMPYEGEDGAALSMLVLLPKGNDLAAVEAALDEEQLAGLKGELVQKEVKVYFPKFRLETEYSLPPTLAAMGMPTAFTTSADFSGMDGKTDLFITGVFHKAFVDVNEEGTEAAAATGIVAGLGMAPVTEPVPVFRADHPFVFLIQDDETGAVLFVGRVTDPAA